MATLVTGGAGFVGGNVVRDLAESGEEVIATDIVKPDELVLRYWGPLRRRITFVAGDLVQPPCIEALADLTHVTRIVHVAAYTAYGDIERLNGRRVCEANVNGTLNVLELARRLEARRFVYASTSGLYRGGEPSEAPYTEESMPDVRQWPYTDPYGLYAITKLAGEIVARRYGHLHDLEVVAVRMSQCFGPLERVTPYHTRISIPGQWTDWAVRGIEIATGARGTGVADVRKFGDDNVYVCDTAAAIRAILEAEAPAYDLYNVSSGRPLEREDLVAAIRRAVPDARVADVASDDLAPSAGRTVLDHSRIRGDLAWSPAHDLDAAIAAFMAWRRESADLL